jgi:hypothetical protein
MLLCLTIKEAVPKNDLYPHPLLSTLHFMPFRLADRSLASPFLNPIPMPLLNVAPEMEPFFFSPDKT